MSAAIYILLVEDDFDLAGSLKEELTARGFNVVSASKVGEALAKLNNQKFGVVLLDLKLENNSGEKIISSLRSPTAKDALNAATPIIVTSGTLDPVVIKRVAPQVQAIMAKPIEVGKLVDKIGELLRKERPKTAYRMPSGNISPDLAEFVHDISNDVSVLDLAVSQLRETLTLRPDLVEEAKVLPIMERAIEKLSQKIRDVREK